MNVPKLEDLTLKEKVGQLLMLRQSVTLLKYTENGFIKRDDEEIRELIKNSPYGSIWSSGQHLFHTVNLIEAKEPITCATNKKISSVITDASRIPMLVGIDCEYGCVFADGTSVCSPLSIGAADDPELTYKLNAAVAREIKAAGANWRWTPIVDLSNRLNGTTVGRSFSDDIDTIIKHACAAIKGTQSERVASTAKHFPGGDPYEMRDSHIVTTKINISLEGWRNTQAKTFQGVIDAGVDSIMVGHVAFPAADDALLNGHNIPATLSKKIIQDILRKEMGFKGVIISDAVNMAGLKTLAPYEDVLVMAINAGNDILLGVNPEDFDAVYQAALDGRIPMSRIDESVERVLRLKEKIGLFEDEQEEIDMVEQSKITKEINRQIAEKGITLLYDKNNMLPLDKNKIKNVTIVCSSHVESTFKQLEVMKKEFEEHGANVQIIGDIPDPETVSRLANEMDLIVYAAYIAPHKPMGMPSLYGDKMKTYINAFAYGKEKSIGISLGYPYTHIDFMAGADTFFNLYSPDPQVQIAFVKAIYGEIELNKKSPIDVEPKLRYVFC